MPIKVDVQNELLTTPPAPTENSPYETCCGLCGAQIHFQQPLTGWTKVYCPGCGEYISVR
jgi:predicted RNA-binding Zn-ribbon protein involved in translation (DUF1610 family)